MNSWKLATIGIALVALTAGATGLTTAYFLRPATAEEPSVAVPAPAPARAAVVSASPVRPRVAQTARGPVAAGDATDCATGSDRAWRIAKPGLLGTLVGAGVGAAGGAVADGGKGAGKGALIGGLTGAVAGSAYGAYRTQRECGTIFGGSAPARAARDGTVVDASAPFAARVPGDAITVYDVR
jgi:uncharacterized protein YcfJ